MRWASREQARNQFQGDTLLQVPQRGLVTLEEDLTQSNSLSESGIVKFSPSSVRWNQMLTKFRLWFQYPWRKIDGKVVLKIKLNGDLSIEPSEKSFFSLKSQQENQEISSLYDLSTLFMFGAYDPRVRGVFVEMGTLQCGYAKLQEVRRMINLFRQSGKKVIGYSEVAKEKELFLAMGFDEFYIPPDGDLQLNGFSASANFVRGALDNIGIEPQVQRIGKYKSFGDTFNRNGISDEQRNVISSLLLQVSDLWAKDVAKQTNNTIVDIKSIWAAKGTRKPVDFVRSGLLSGIKYFDQVEEIVNTRFQSKKNKWSAWTWIAKMLARLNKIVLVDNTEAQYKEKTQEFDLQHDFEKYPRRRSSTSTTPALLTSEPPATAAVNQSANHTDATTEPVELSKQATAVNETARIIEFPFTAAPKATLLPGGSYLRKMTAGWGLLKGLPIKEVQSGQRIAIINAAGAIGSGESRGGLMGPVLGAETLIGQIRRARDDSDIKAVVLRVDSPGGSALASDLIWRELRLLSRVKPVVASQVDVAGKYDPF